MEKAIFCSFFGHVKNWVRGC